MSALIDFAMAQSRLIRAHAKNGTTPPPLSAADLVSLRAWNWRQTGLRPGSRFDLLQRQAHQQDI